MSGIKTHSAVSLRSTVQKDPMKKARKLDAIDKKVLSILQHEARISNMELAERVSLSPSACLQRTKTLQDAGYILQYVMVVDLDRLCVNVKVFAEITLASHRPQELARFEEVMRKIPEIADCLRVNGRVDYIALVVCSTIADFNALSVDLLARDIGIMRIDSSTVLDTPKWFGGYPFNKLQWKA
jgi:Lrp/AsnC family leucine-responsive transcriptional regulator